MCPGGRYIELFGRPHNCRENWITLGNQLPGVYIKDDEILKRLIECITEKVN
jgi:mRNA (2'-O-methyladenosine-N6-)-methyltransferase